MKSPILSNSLSLKLAVDQDKLEPGSNSFLKHIESRVQPGNHWQIALIALDKGGKSGHTKRQPYHLIVCHKELVAVMKVVKLKTEKKTLIKSD